MSDITMDYVTCSMQIVVIVSAVYILRLIIPRRDVASHAFVLSFGTLLVTLLTIVALIGDSAFVARTSRELATTIYDVSRSLRPAQPSNDDFSVDQPVNDSKQAGLSLNLSFASIAEHVSAAVTANRAIAKASVIRAVRWSLVGCIVVAIVRLGLGLFWWSRLCKRSPAVASEKLQTLVFRLKSKMRLTQTFDVRENTNISTAATVGFFRPVILLSTDWRLWSNDELNSVLAHEMAHIKRRDYFTRALSETCVALHIYNPLVHAIKCSLDLAQESCADALATEVTGDRSGYAKNLASLALRQDTKLIRRPALCFLSLRPSNLMRRIDMLCTKDGAANPTATTARCVAFSIVLSLLTACIATVVADDLRKPSAQTTKRLTTEGTAEDVLPIRGDEVPFNLSFIDSRSDGVAAIRCARLFNRPELKPVADIGQQAIRKILIAYGVDPNLTVSLDDMEQVIGPVALSHNPDKPKGQRHAFMLGLSYCRATHDYDWVGLITSFAPETNVRIEGESKHLENVSIPAIFPGSTQLDVADSRGIGCRASLHNGRRLSVENNAHPMSTAIPLHETWPVGWSTVKDADIALLLDNREQAWSVALEDDIAHQGLTALWNKAAVGIHFDETMHIQIIVSCFNEDAASEFCTKVPQMLHDWCETGIDAATDEETDAVRRTRRILGDTIDHIQIEQKQNSVTIKLDPAFSTSELLTIAAKLMLEDLFDVDQEVAQEQSSETLKR